MDMTPLTEMLKTQFMTITMMKSANESHGLMPRVYIFLFTGMVDFLCKTVGPFLVQRGKEYYDQKIKPEFKEFQEKSKTSSITILVKISDHENVVGQALLDFITHHPHTKHILYKKQNFIL